MNTPETLTTRIHAQADAKLKSDLAELTARFMTDLTALCDISSVSIARAFLQVREGDTITSLANVPDRIRVSVAAIMNAIPDEGFAIAREANREAAMDEFLLTIDELVKVSPELQEKIAVAKATPKTTI